MEVPFPPAFAKFVYSSYFADVAFKHPAGFQKKLTPGRSHTRFITPDGVTEIKSKKGGE
jgi:hypothetical protein